MPKPRTRAKAKAKSSTAAPAPASSTATTRGIRAGLLAFYDEHARDLPWRRTSDPYAIWVSEIMLQQTRVETVLGYYARFLARFPTPHALADASQDQVLAAWSGLGYYRRARLLHAGVRDVVANYDGQVPSDPEARRKLPGIGRYTAGAIGSIAFGLCEPIVDGNVARVLSRVHAIDTPLGRSDTEARLWQYASELVQGERPGALNQALMELGATICGKGTPRCSRCPIQKHCRAYAQGLTDQLPVARKKIAPKLVQLVAVAAVSGKRDAVTLVRGDSELFHGLWNLPMREGRGADEAQRVLADAGIDARLGPEPLAILEHVLTHRRLQVELWSAQLTRVRSGAKRKTGSVRDHKLVAFAELDQLGTSTLTRNALAWIDRTL